MADYIAQPVATMPRQSMVTLTHVLYGMHAFSALMGVLGTTFIITSFLTGWPSIIAVIVNYIKRDEVRGTFLDSHFSWQLRTFWYALLWVFVIGLLIITLIGIPIAWVVAIVVGIWVLYRILRGWINLASHQPMPMKP
jgi:uncharacterized membrane protein